MRARPSVRWGRSGGAGCRGSAGPEPSTASRASRPRSANCSRVRVHEVGDGAQRAGGVVLQVGAPARRPEEHDRADPRAGREAPAFEAVRDRRVRRRNRHRQDEREDRSGRGRREVAADHAGEERDEADDRHRACGEPRVSRAERPERDEDGAGAREPGVGERGASAAGRRTRRARASRTSRTPRGSTSAAARSPCPRARRPPG